MSPLARTSHPTSRLARSDDVLNAAFIEGGEKDDINIFIDAMTCDPRPAETYKLERHKWTLSHGAGATVYQVSRSLYPCCCIADEFFFF